MWTRSSTLEFINPLRHRQIIDLELPPSELEGVSAIGFKMLEVALRPRRSLLRVGPAAETKTWPWWRTLYVLLHEAARRESSRQILKDFAFQDLLRAYHSGMSMNSSLWTVPSILRQNEREAVDLTGTYSSASVEEDGKTRHRILEAEGDDLLEEATYQLVLEQLRRIVT
ncbi:hypothetical protein HWV62_1130 [Athelia sp. TMB]|nr:hypothetical protein HWV62_1130 [Athelia sp. TMB]